MPRLKTLEVIGFRAFGSARQALDFEKDLAVIYAPNSHGKTSLAEAIEFLLTGTTSRRELIGSAVREFADALRNAHLADGVQVSVRASIEAADGTKHVVERKLVADCSATGDCASQLTIDGVAAVDLSRLGFTLSQPPLAAPILMPHGLRYVFQAEPSQRTAYFKMLLEMADLDDVRRRVAALHLSISTPASETLARYSNSGRNAVFGARLSRCGTSVGSVRDALRDAISLAAGSPTELPDTLEERVTYLAGMLAEKQRAVFPLDALRPGAEPGWKPPAGTLFDNVIEYRRLLSTIDADLGRVEALYTTLLEIPTFRDLKPLAKTTCPVCKTDGGLTGERIEQIRSELKSSATVTKARTKAAASLSELKGQVAKALQAISGCKPPVFGWSAAERMRHGFSMEQLGGLLGDDGSAALDQWRTAANDLQSAITRAELALKPHETTIAALRLDAVDEEAAAAGRAALEATGETVKSVASAYSAYVAAHDAIVKRLQPVLTSRTSTDGWAQLLALAAEPAVIAAAMCEDRAQRATQQDLETALKQIDAAIAEVLDSKYEHLGAEVSRWWQLMRPDTTTKFSGLQRAGTGRRFIDMKAGLFEADARPKPKAVRDAVAVFSDSQLNCLGLAAFLARTVRQKSGFIVLDDPFPGSDPDHRTIFIDAVLPALAGEGVQVILLTHDDRAVLDAQALYAEAGIDSFEIALSDPIAGATVTRTKDDLDVLLAKANGLLGTSSVAAEPRKLAASHLRDAAERFCKLLVVKDRRAKGRPAVPSDLNENLGKLIPMAEPLLTQDTGDPGKLRVIPGRLNPGNHDDAVPTLADLKNSHGTLRDLKKRYLDRS